MDKVSYDQGGHRAGWPLLLAGVLLVIGLLNGGLVGLVLLLFAAAFLVPSLVALLLVPPHDVEARPRPWERDRA